MPDLDGVAATRPLRAERLALPVVALTTFDDKALAGMLRSGAAGFVRVETNGVRRTVSSPTGAQ